MYRWLYTLAWWLALPVAFAYLWRRGRKQPAYRANWAERLGRYAQQPTGPVIWLHAVSVGETRAAQPLVEALLAQYPRHTVLLTQMTPTGRETAHQLYGDRVQVAYLPYDLPFAVSRFLRHFKPQLGVLMEMELWPNLIHSTRNAGVPLYLINARLSERSFRGYQRVHGLIGPAVARFSGVLAQGQDDAARLTQLGAAHIRIAGNLKYDLAPPAKQIAIGRQWRTQWSAARPAWAAACTRDGEEALLLDALAAAKLPDDALMVLVPRHPQRFDEVAALLDARGMRYIRRSQWDATHALPADTQVLLGDSLGELASYYAACDVAFVGGSLLDFGCHSVIEPAAVGLPVVIGPSDYNFKDAVTEALALGAAHQHADAVSLLVDVATLLACPAQREIMAQAAQTLIAHHRGALARTLAALPNLA
ncbi:MAG: lipid IV(A) 3-deoxy-D-manno-octulosonic acid transferase [Burkholderiales bacterium]|nr:lipid IV(A) 3-deoxy-D-manno-octulosonic acid transferase [Burkholderiales bacterium]